LEGHFFRSRPTAAQLAAPIAGAVLPKRKSCRNFCAQPIAHGADDTYASALANLTKGGLNSVTKALAIEYAAKGIRVNAVSPGIIKTPMHAPETHEFLAGLHPMKRMGEVHDIVQAILYLESAGFVTGEILHVDGGQSAGH